MDLYVPRINCNRKKRRPVEPEMTFAHLCYRGVHYSKWVCTNSLELRYQRIHGDPMTDWKLDW